MPLTERDVDRYVTEVRGLFQLKRFPSGKIPTVKGGRFPQDAEVMKRWVVPAAALANNLYDEMRTAEKTAKARMRVEKLHAQIVKGVVQLIGNFALISRKGAREKLLPAAFENMLGDDFRGLEAEDQWLVISHLAGDYVELNAIFRNDKRCALHSPALYISPAQAREFLAHPSAAFLPPNVRRMVLLNNPAHFPEVTHKVFEGFTLIKNDRRFIDVPDEMIARAAHHYRGDIEVFLEEVLASPFLIEDEEVKARLQLPDYFDAKVRYRANPVPKLMKRFRGIQMGRQTDAELAALEKTLA